MELTILVWNVLYGFRDESTKKLDLVRRSLAKEVIQIYKPDLFAVIEANEKDSCVYRNYFDFCASSEVSWLGDEGDVWGTSVMSAIPFKETGEFVFPLGQNCDRFHTRKALRVQLDIKSKLVTIDALHPDPHFSPQGRIRGIDAMIDGFELENHLILGDLNCYSYLDDYSQIKEELIRCYRQSKRITLSNYTPETVTDMYLEALFAKHLRSRGYRDAFENFERYPTIPTKLVNGSPKAPVKIDHVFVSENINVTHAEVIRNFHAAEYASDHRAILVKIKI